MAEQYFCTIHPNFEYFCTKHYKLNISARRKKIIRVAPLGMSRNIHLCICMIERSWKLHKVNTWCPIQEPGHFCLRPLSSDWREMASERHHNRQQGLMGRTWSCWLFCVYAQLGEELLGQKFSKSGQYQGWVGVWPMLHSVCVMLRFDF